jgi:hypothetical protein
MLRWSITLTAILKQVESPDIMWADLDIVLDSQCYYLLHFILTLDIGCLFVFLCN